MRLPGAIRVLLLGMRCGFTLPVAEALIADPGIDVAGLVVPEETPATLRGRPFRESDTGQFSLDMTLRQHRIPLIETSSLHKRVLEPLLTRLDPGSLDAIVVACLLWRVPRWLRTLPRLAALNVHPSLLPALRGPQPEFWAMRLGLRETGVTIHLMDDGLDTGPILLQRPVAIPANVTLPALEATLATVGGELAGEALSRLAAGDIEPRSQRGTPTYAPNPGPYDLTIPTDLPAGWAARFARAVAPVYAPLSVLVMATGQRLLVGGVIDADERAVLPAPVQADGNTVAIRFSPGVVRFHRAAADAGAGDT